MTRLIAVLPEPWMCLCVAHALGPDLRGVVTFGDADQVARFDALGVPAVVLTPPLDTDTDASTTTLLAAPEAQDFIGTAPSTLLCFKPSRRLEQAAAALGATVALAEATLAQGLENKLALRALAAEGGVPVEPGPEHNFGLPRQSSVRIGPDTSLRDLRAAVDRADTDEPVVLQAARGYMGRKTWLVEGEAQWASLRDEIEGRPCRVTRVVRGRPGTVNAVVDAEGTVLCSSPIVQVTGEPALTLYPLGSCGNDFTWRPLPHPGDGPYQLVRHLGAALATRGYRGHFGVDFVLEDRERPTSWLIEVNPRLTASMALYSVFHPSLLRAHLAVLDGSSLRTTGELPPVEAGQLIAQHGGATDTVPLSETQTGYRVGQASLPVDEPLTWPSETPVVGPGGKRGRIVTRGPVVLADGSLALRLPSEA